MSMLSIRPATAADIPAITRIYGHAVRHGTASFELETPDEAEMMRRMRALRDAGYPYLVAETDAVAGYAYAGAYRARPAYRFSVENSVYFDPKAQGRGAGKLIMQELIARCEHRGFRQMVAVIGDSANAGSIAVHRACGFEHTGVFRAAGWKFDRWLDVVLMQKALGPGDATPGPAA